MNKQVSSITESAGSMLENINNAIANPEISWDGEGGKWDSMVKEAVSYIRETDEIIGVHTDITPGDVQELLASFNYTMSTGTIFDYLK